MSGIPITPPENLLPKDLFGPYTHVGLVVRDMDATLAHIKALFGCEPAGFGETPATDDRRYMGEFEDFAVKMAFIPMEDTEFEVLMPLRGRNVWQDFLDAHGDGLHHINFKTSRYDEACAHLTAQGLTMDICGQQSRNPGKRWCYFNAMDVLGMYIEVAEK